MTRSFLPKYDAIIVGSGPGGSAAAYRLAKAGKKILVVERGKALKPNAVIERDKIGRYLYDTIGHSESAAQFVGGQSKFYGAALYRMRESDFEAVEHETGISPAWPFRYADLEPYYAEAERLYKVHGDAASDPTEPPRSGPLPHQPLPHSTTVAPVLQRLEAAGTVVSAIPRGLDYGDGGKCVLCATCDVYYCQYDAKMDAENATLRPAMMTNNVDLALGVTCKRILTNDDGQRVTGIEIDVDGETRTIDSEVVIVGAGIPGTIELLYASRNEKHPTGLGNSTGNLGRHLGGHSTGMIMPLISFGNVPANHTKTFSINTFYHGAPGSKYPLGIIQAAGQMPYWRTASKVMKLPAWLVSKSSLTCFYMVEAIPSHESGYRLSPTGVHEKVEPKLNENAFALLRKKAIETFKAAGYASIARQREPYFWHETGTACIGNDKATSVCNANCEVHDVQNLYVVDASALPSAGAVNTCLTIVALALKASSSIVEKFEKPRI